MRLINTETFRLEEFPDERSVKYAVLSHRWEQQEVLFKHAMSSEGRKILKALQGFYKIKKCCDLAKSEGIPYAWVDTCCIDKGSSAELQEAINSMFRWYKSAVVCYAYLSDVAPNQSGGYVIGNSQWFKRGWTLQELLAPKEVVFYSCNWSIIGTRKSRAWEITPVTGIPRAILEKEFIADGRVLAAEIMSWAKGRQTTRVEDKAYSLLGLFDVSIPMLYGEGERAFDRLQEAILKYSEDQSLFAWSGIDLAKPGLLARTANGFPDMRRCDFSGRMRRRQSPAVTSEGVIVEFSLLPWAPNTYLAILNYEFTIDGEEPLQHGIFLRAVDQDNRFVRVKYAGEDLWVGSEFSGDLDGRRFHEGRSRVMKVTVVRRLHDDELVAARRLGSDVFMVSIAGWCDNWTVNNTRDVNKRVSMYERWKTEQNPVLPLLSMVPGTCGWVTSFQVPEAVKATGTLRSIILGFDFQFNPICYLSSGSFEGDGRYIFDRFLWNNSIWRSLDDSIVQDSLDDNFAGKNPLFISHVRGGEVWIKESEPGTLVMRFDNKFGMGKNPIIEIDARTQTSRGKQGMMELQIAGYSPMNFHIRQGWSS